MGGDIIRHLDTIPVLGEDTRLWDSGPEADILKKTPQDTSTSISCWRLTPLGCSPYIFHSHWMGNATTISYKPKTNDGFTSVPPLLASYHLKP